MSGNQKTITKRAGIVGIGTLASRILGLVRESVIAAFFPTWMVEAYLIAFMIPNSFRRLTAEGSFSISVVSVFSKTWAQGDLEASRRFVKAVTGFSIVFLLVLATVGVLGAEGLTWLATKGDTSNPEKFSLAVSLTRLMFPYVFFVSLMALAMGILNSAGRFFAPAFAPVLLNVAIIGCAVGLCGTFESAGIAPVFALAVGVLIGGVAQIVCQIPSLRALNLLVLPSLDFKHSGLIKVLKLTGPMIFGAAAYQIGLFISNSLAWSLGDGAVKYIQFSTRLMELPLAVLVMAISTAALPSLAALRGLGKMDEVKETYSHSLRLALFVATPAMFGLIALAEPVVAILYQRGHFSYEDTINTAAALRWMAIGICSIALLRQTVPVFYALEQVKVPVVMSVVYIISYVACALPLMGLLGFEGLCIALSVGATVQALGLVIVLRRRIGNLGFKKTILSWFRILAASVPLGVAAYGVSLIGVWPDGGNSPRNIGVLIAAVIAGVAAYILAAYILRVKEFRDLLSALKRRRNRSK